MNRRSFFKRVAGIAVGVSAGSFMVPTKTPQRLHNDEHRPLTRKELQAWQNVVRSYQCNEIKIRKPNKFPVVRGGV